MNRQQADVLDYLIGENRLLEEQLKGRRPRLHDDQRTRPVAAAWAHPSRPARQERTFPATAATGPPRQDGGCSAVSEDDVDSTLILGGEDRWSGTPRRVIRTVHCSKQ
jgi:hypothetical protein